jgi:hypothetical protein
MITELTYGSSEIFLIPAHFSQPRALNLQVSATNGDFREKLEIYLK